MAKMYRCMNCASDKQVPGRDFVAEKPVCPHCGLDGTPGKPHGDLVVPLRTLHFDPPHGTVKGRGVNLPACGQERKAGTAMTGDPDVANCPKCRATPAWAAAKATNDSGPDDIDLPAGATLPENIEVTIDAANQKYTKAGE